MVWFNVDDGSTFHPKVLAVGNAAWGAFTRLGAYAAKHVTEGAEGYVPDEIVRMVATRGELTKLLNGGFLHKVDGGVTLHDYLDYNRDGATVSRDRAKAAERQQRKRDRDRERDELERHGVTRPVTPPVSHGPQDQAKPIAVHLRDTPPPRHGSSAGGGPVDKKRAAVLASYGRIALDGAKRAGTHITSDVGYTNAAKRTGAEHPDLERYLAEYPDAPPDAVAAWLHGDKHSMQYQQRIDPNAPDADVIALRQNTA